MPNTLPVALQLYTVRDRLKDDLAGTLQAVRDIGYENVELAGLYGRSAEQFKSELDKAGLTAVSTHVGIDRIEEDLQTVVDHARLFGYRHVAIPFFPEDRRTAEGYLELARLIDRCETSPIATGLTFSYHNHAFEFDKLEDGRRGFDILFSQPSPSSEMDVYWVARGGDNPLQWLERLSGRVPLLHMKDMAKDGDVADAGFAEVGTGRLPLEEIAFKADDHGVEHLIIEQDNGWIDGDPLKSAKISYDNLIAMMDR
jgi:sugar phosphate isomerase/epimerase